MTSIEYASLGELQRRDVNSNGLDREAAAELRRRAMTTRLGTSRGRDPHQLLKELERRRHPDGAPRDLLVATYARLRHTRDPRQALLATWAMRIDQGW
jgi:hypothetical protein